MTADCFYPWLLSYCFTLAENVNETWEGINSSRNRMTYWRGCWRDRRPGSPCWWAARRREGSCRRGCRCRRWRSAASRRWSRSRPRVETHCCSAPGRTLLSNPKHVLRSCMICIFYSWDGTMTMFLAGDEREEKAREVLVTLTILFCQPH